MLSIKFVPISTNDVRAIQTEMEECHVCMCGLLAIIVTIVVLTRSDSK